MSDRCPVHGIPDCSPILNGCSRLVAAAEQADKGEAADTPRDEPCSHRWRAFPPDGKRYGYWRCDECGRQNEGPMCLVTTKERGVYRDPDTTAVQYVAAAEQADKGEAADV